MVFNATVINISDISWWRSVLLVEETGVPGENPQPLASHSQTVSYNVVSRTPRHERDSNLSGDMQGWIQGEAHPARDPLKLEKI
jgi:S1-C subfamily serine protease